MKLVQKFKIYVLPWIVLVGVTVTISSFAWLMAMGADKLRETEARDRETSKLARAWCNQRCAPYVASDWRKDGCVCDLTRKFVADN